MQVTVTALFLLLQIAMLIIFATTVEYTVPTSPQVAYSYGIYNMWQDVHVMIAIGFGFLMAFLYRNAFTTTGHSFMIMVFVTFWSILNRGFWDRATGGKPWDKKIDLGVVQMILADFNTGGILISFGALVGRLSGDQLLIMAFFETIFFCINEAIAVHKYEVADIGGSMIIHTFGAYFGLAVSAVLESGNAARAATLEKYKGFNGSDKTSDTFAMIGTLFLWCFWPSFNAALSGNRAEMAQVNTFLAISSSALMAFYVIAFVKKGKFHMVEIQNATLAGGVAVGAVANMHIEPWGAILLGGVAGTLSVFGYQVLQDRLPIRDTCGINNLHGMPGILGAIASIIVAGMVTKEQYVWGSSGPEEVFFRLKKHPLDAGDLALYQFWTLITTLGFALVGGAFTGAILRLLPSLNLIRFFNDTEEWDHVEVDAELQAAESADGSQTEMASVKSVEPVSTA